LPQASGVAWQRRGQAREARTGAARGRRGLGRRPDYGSSSVSQ
jgi:hypothetical protein